MDSLFGGDGPGLLLFFGCVVKIAVLINYFLCV